MNGSKTAIMGSIMGFAVSAVVGALLLAVMPGTGSSLAFLFNMVSILIGIASLNKLNYWGILYSVGYFGGLLLIGRFFMERWEYPIYLLIIGAFIALKIFRKL